MKQMKKITNGLLSITLILSCFGIISPMEVKANNDFESGSGTENDPYMIKNATQLQNINNYCGDKGKEKYFKLSNDIDASKIKKFKPICQAENNEFKGVFDGNNKTIKSLTIDETTAVVGLFGRISGYNYATAGEKATIKNLTIDKNSSIKSTENSVGAFAGYIENTKIVNVINKATITGKSSVGGIVGRAFNHSEIINVWNESEIISKDRDIGGVVGYLHLSHISSAYNEGKISAGKDSNGNSVAGGIVGYTSSSDIENVSNNGGIVGTGSLVGGIIGSTWSHLEISNIANYNQNIKAEKNNEGQFYLGLLIGIDYNSYGTIKNAYTIKENNNYNEINIYNIQKKLETENIKGYTAEELKKQSNYVGFDFDNVWIMNNGKAELRFVDELKNIKVETNADDSKKENTTTSNVIDGPKIYFDSQYLHIDSFLYKDRTYINLKDFCEESAMCSVTNDGDSYIIRKSEEFTSNSLETKFDNSNLMYTYTVSHKKGSKEFRPIITIGGYDIAKYRSIEDDVTNQVSDVESCPSEVKEYKCDKENFYVPVRFLTQSLGFKVEWDGERNEVKIKNTLLESFQKKYDIVTTTKKDCNSSNCIVNRNSNITSVKNNNTYYLNVINKEIGKLMDFPRLYSFYGSIKNSGQKLNNPKYVNGIFTIGKNDITINNNTLSNKIKGIDVAQIIVFEIKDTDDGYQKSDYNVGGYPIVINNAFVCTDC